MASLASTWSVFVILFWASVPLLALLLYSLRARVLPGIPHIPTTWFFGHLLDIRANLDRLHDWHLTMFRQLKASVFQVCLPGMAPAVFLHSPENIEYFMKTNFENFVKAGFFRTNMGDVLGDGIFVADGESWREKRKVASHMFSEKVLRDDMHRIFAAHARKVIKIIRERSVNAGAHIDLQTIFFQFTMDSICEIAFGQDLDTLNSESFFGTAFDNAQAISYRRFSTPPFIWKLEKALGIGLEAQLAHHIQTMQTFCKKVIEDRQKVREDDLRMYPDLLSRFISEARQRQTELTESYLRDVILNFMLAGRDTTACLLTWAAWELWKRPEEEKRLMAEIAEVRTFTLPDQDWVPSFRDVADLKYMDAFLHETLRLHPSVPSDAKVAAKDCVLPDGGYKLPAGTQVGFNPYSIGRSTLIWGRDAEEFNPVRWLTERKYSQWEFPHFNAGARVCLGQHVAILEAKVLFAALLNAFSWNVADNHDPVYRISVVLAMKFGLPTLFRPRENPKPPGTAGATSVHS